MTTSGFDQLSAGVVVEGPLLPEPVEVLTTVPMGTSIKLIGKGLKTGQVHEPILDADKLGQLTLTPKDLPFDGDAHRFKLGIEAARLGLAYEYDPYFSLSIARVDPLPHQLEAVYDYFLKLPRIRFLLADDPGAGKTIMAGLLLKELKVRGLVTRTLIVAPANLTFQWQREMKDKFREQFDVMRGSVLRTQYGQNPWQEHNQVVTSVSWISRVEDAKESLLRSTWDLVVVDEAHKMSAYSSDKKTLAFQIGEELSNRTDHFLLMTATPHKGDPENFRLFLSLLDKDVYGDVKSLEEAMRRQEAPFYLRRLKEALVTFPDNETGEVRKLFTKREVRTAKFDLDGDEFDFYDALTRYVEDQSIKAAANESPQARAMGFTMAMLQRRFASSMYAVRRSLERMSAKRKKILEDPEKYRQEQIHKKLPDDFEDLTEEEQQEIIANLEDVVISIDPAVLKDEIQRLDKLVDHAKSLEKREVESKLTKLKDVLQEQHIFSDKKVKLLIFTEHKDTLDYLVGDGKDGRPFGKLREWGLTVTQIHGGMKIGDRDTENTRIWAEREFKENAQVLVATEAAGEGINLQFCWMMVNYDIPWNPVRLEQRMGRIHRYGQVKDCLIFNFAAVNTREGRVLEKLLHRLAEIKDELGTDKVFDVVGEVFPSNLLEKMFREMYAKKLTEDNISDRIVEDIDPERFKKITGSTLEGLAKKELNLSALIGKNVEAKERRLVPEVIEDFFVAAGPIAGVHPNPVRGRPHVFRIGKIPKTLSPIGEKLECRFGRLGKEYQRVVFDKALLGDDGTLEWVTPGHPLFECVRTDVEDRSRKDLRRGTVLWDLHTKAPYRLDVFSAAIKDGRANTLHRRLFVVRTAVDGTLSVRQPTAFLDLIAPEAPVKPPKVDGLPTRTSLEAYLLDHALQDFLTDIGAHRADESKRVREHVEISLGELINRQNITLAELVTKQEAGDPTPGLAGNVKLASDHLDELNGRLDRRLLELEKERHCTIGSVHYIGQAWILPHPEQGSPNIAPMVRDDEIEKIAVRIAMEYERSRGWVVESVEEENRGFDLISRKPHPHDDKTFTEVRFIEVKGRSGVGTVALSANEYRTAQRLGDDYWLYVVFDCASEPKLNTIQDPAKLGWEPVVKVEHYHVGAKEIQEAAGEPER
jgi:superfamily II DNA or RNA helicase